MEMNVLSAIEHHITNFPTPNSCVSHNQSSPLSSTTGRADTLWSTKIPSAVYRGVSVWTMAMFWNVPMSSSSKDFDRNAGLGISEI